MLITHVILMDKHTDVCLNLRLVTSSSEAISVNEIGLYHVTEEFFRLSYLVALLNVHSSYKLILSLRSALLNGAEGVLVIGNRNPNSTSSAMSLFSYFKIEVGKRSFWIIVPIIEVKD